MAQNLQIIVEAVDTLLDESETETVDGTTMTTFSTLETKLETLLQDGVGGTPAVSMNTTYNSVRSELILEIELKWTYSEFIEMTVNMDKVLNDSGLDLTGDIGIFAKSMVPSGEGGASVKLDGAVSFTLGVGVEYISSEKKTNAYILGSTGFQAEFTAVGDFSYDMQIGPLKGVLDGNILVHGRGAESDPLSLRVGLDPSSNYYIAPPGPTSSTREGFTEVSGVGGLLDELDFEFDGRVTAHIEAGLPLIVCNAIIDVVVTDLEQLIRGNRSTLEVEYSVTTPKFKVPTFLDILLLEPQGIIDALNDVFRSVEDASLGPKGIVTTFNFPFIRKSLAQALGAGTPDNIFGRGRRYIIPTLQAGLDSFEGNTDTVADVLARLMEMAIDEIGILNPGKKVTTTCYHFDKTTKTQVPHSSCIVKEPEIQSLMWTIPFGQKFTVKVPLDFDLDAGSFPLEMEFTGNGNAVPQLEIGWYFNLAFGFDEIAGFFLYTYPGGQQEFSVYAIMSVLDRKLTATLIMLKGTFDDFDLVFGASVYVNLDKAKALRRADSPGDAQYGRITRGNLREMAKLSDMFSIGVLTGATISIGKVTFELNTDMFPGALKRVKPWIPTVEAVIHAQARKNIGILNRRLESSEVGTQNHHLERFLEGSSHRAIPLLRSLTGESPLLDVGFQFPQCPVEMNKGQTFCAKVKSITLVMEKIIDLVRPILFEFVNSDKDGYLDKVMDPFVLFLNKRLPGISDILDKDVTPLDIAETYCGPKAHADTIRKIIKIYEYIRDDLIPQFEEGGGILIAEECDVMKGFKCTGGVFDLAGSRRLTEDTHALFAHKDYSDFRTTPFEIVREERELQYCPSEFIKPKCTGTCDGCGTTVSKGVCKAKKLKCNAASVEGLSFPFLTDLTQIIGLLGGKDIVRICIFKKLSRHSILTHSLCSLP